MKNKKSITWLRYVVVQHALGLGLTTGAALPLLNAAFRPDPGYDVVHALGLSVPFFVTAWCLFGIYRWRKDKQAAAPRQPSRPQ
ncbi:hypothetical protein PE066_09095 [Ramlibacter tataouinensis]|uniref:hypothetical protein n=1 Tax=Ramlibacter tataouinensis TaxID=94132 RepID=UPI0022F3E32C|nr:hypothetical protein [Ramlibacter tataouinensis]WBY03669.1 hypothetical protein PE066_09095 [Ramlibacter tataouinensis]